MRSRRLSKRIKLIIVITGIAFLVIFFGYFITTNSNWLARSTEQTNAWLTQSGSIPLTANVVAVFEQKKVVLGTPVPIRIIIPKININATIESVGLTSQKAVGVPKGPVNVAWFNLGPHPGDSGNAIIVGHFGWKDSKPAVFDSLSKLLPGDKLYVIDEKEAATTFVVRESQRYDPNADASKVFISNDGKSHLNLITCEGVWDKVSKSYSKRLVVFTDKE